MKIIRTEILPDFEYFKTEEKKDTIVLHHTVSSVGKYVDDWFKADRGKSKVAVAYVVDKDGTVYELFNPKYWAYHTGTGNRNNIDKRSIAIEVVNEGALIKKGDEYFWFDGKYKYKGEVYPAFSKWRGFEYFASYTEKQADSVSNLIFYLWDLFKEIPFKFSNTLDYDEKWFDFKGIITHANIRKDKTDLSPAFPLYRIYDMCRILNSIQLQARDLRVIEKVVKEKIFIKDILKY